MTCGIYRIRCKNGESYWGSSKNIERRFTEHKSYLKRKKHGNGNLQKLYNENGIEYFTFEKIEECKICDLEKREKFYLEKDEDKLNIWILPFSPKGCKRINKRIWSDEVKRKISISVKLSHEIKGHPFLGKNHSEKTRKKISNAKLGRKWTEENKIKIKGRKSGMLGKKHSEETKIKLSIMKKGKISPLKGKWQIFPTEKICRECKEIKNINLFEFTRNCYRNICKKCRESKRIYKR